LAFERDSSVGFFHKWHNSLSSSHQLTKQQKRLGSYGLKPAKKKKKK